MFREDHECEYRFLLDEQINCLTPLKNIRYIKIKIYHENRMKKSNIQNCLQKIPIFIIGWKKWQYSEWSEKNANIHNGLKNIYPIFRMVWKKIFNIQNGLKKISNIQNRLKKITNIQICFRQWKLYDNQCILSIYSI